MASWGCHKRDQVSTDLGDLERQDLISLYVPQGLIIFFFKSFKNVYFFILREREIGSERGSQAVSMLSE